MVRVLIIFFFFGFIRKSIVMKTGIRTEIADFDFHASLRTLKKSNNEGKRHKKIQYVSVFKL